MDSITKISNSLPKLLTTKLQDIPYDFLLNYKDQQYNKYDFGVENNKNI